MAPPIHRSAAPAAPVVAAAHSRHLPKRRSTFEVAAQWDAVVEDLSLYSPMLGLQLLCTKGAMGAVQNGEATLSIAFPPQRKGFKETLADSDRLIEQLKGYFSDALDCLVEIELQMSQEDDEEAVARFEDRQLELRSDGLYQIDLKREPLLRRIQELFDTRYLSTVANQNEPQPPSGELDEYSEDDERDAEDAE